MTRRVGFRSRRRPPRPAVARGTQPLAPGLSGACGATGSRSPSSALFVLIVALLSSPRPLWAERRRPHRAEHDPHAGEDHGRRRSSAMSSTPKAQPIGPLWFGAGGKFFLGADGRLGRDEMVRLMYGGRTSLFIGIVSALITTVLAIVLGLLAGYYRGWIDTVISRAMDVIWAFPVAAARRSPSGIALAVGGLKIGPIDDLGRLDLDPDPDHRRRVRALHGATDPRRGPRPAREGVRRGRGRPGRRPAADHVRRAAAQPLARRSSSSSPSTSPTTCCSSRRSPSSAPACSRPTPPGER